MKFVVTPRAVQVSASLTILVLLSQFVTAGRLFGPDGPETLHAAGAIVLHVVTGLTLVAVFLRRRAAGGPLWPTGLSAVVFVATFVQAATGGREHLAWHIPGAMVLTVGSVWLTAWAFTSGTPSASDRDRMATTSTTTSGS